jgi:hypothetical protein
MHVLSFIKKGVTVAQGPVFKLFLCFAVGAIGFSGCSRQNDGNGGMAPTRNTFAPAEQADVISAQDNHLQKVEVTVTAPIKKVLPDDTKGLPHERFLLLLANGSTVLIAHDTAMAPRVPLNAGDNVTIHGEYIWNERGGVIHWTHHSDNGRHEGGYIDYQGQRYQ